MKTDKREARIYLSPPHMGGEEIRFVQAAFQSNYIAPLGPMVDAFEKEFAEYTGMKHCAAVSSGTAAVHLALRCLGVGPGDEVFTSTLTFIGSVTPIVFQGAVPVFIDSERVSWNMDPDLLEEELERCAKAGKLPKAVLPTDLYGQCCNYKRILDLCARYEVPVVADAAEAVGAGYFTQRRQDGAKGGTQNPKIFLDGDARSGLVHAGKGARAAVFSFNGNKIITTSGGGMLASDDGELIAYVRKLSTQARELAPHYEHTEIGYNYRMSNIVAGIGRGQLRVIEQRVRRKRDIFGYYGQALGDLPGIAFMPEAPWARSTRWLTVITVDPDTFGANREEIRLALEAENIESRPVWKPMHSQPVFGGLGKDIEARGRGCGVCSSSRRGGAKDRSMKRDGRYPCRVVGGDVAEGLFLRGLCLPCGTALSEADLERVVKIIRAQGKATPHNHCH